MEILRLTVRVDLGGHTPVAIDATTVRVDLGGHTPVAIDATP